MTAGLTLSEPVKDEVRNTHKQYLKLHGKRALISIPEFFKETGLQFMLNNKVTSVLVPLTDNTRAIFSSLESFVQENVQSEKYKPLWLRDRMYVNVSQWCQYEQVNTDGTLTALHTGTLFGRGTYSMLIHASHVYVGPHKGGETYSLSLHVVNITFKPADDLMELIENISSEFDTSPPPPSTPEQALCEVKKPSKKKRAPRVKKQENFSFKTAAATTSSASNVL